MLSLFRNTNLVNYRVAIYKYNQSIRVAKKTKLLIHFGSMKETSYTEDLHTIYFLEKKTFFCFYELQDSDFKSCTLLNTIHLAIYVTKTYIMRTFL